MLNSCFENSNNIPTITLDGLKNKIRMSANEMLCFARCLGLLIADFVPTNLPIWKLWSCLVEILDIVTCPNLHFSEGKRVDIVIQDYLKIVITYFKNLKPKHHHLLHYAMVYDMSGPLVHLWGMKYEQKHKLFKLNSNVSGSFKNIIHTLANKYIDINGVTYKEGVVIITEAVEMPVFGIVEHIFIHKECSVYFYFKKLISLCFNKHFHCYEVCETLMKECIPYKALHDHVPCTLSRKSDKVLVLLKYIC